MIMLRDKRNLVAGIGGGYDGKGGRGCVVCGCKREDLPTNRSDDSTLAICVLLIV